jgi:hypothetical protein
MEMIRVTQIVILNKTIFKLKINLIYEECNLLKILYNSK